MPATRDLRALAISAAYLLVVLAAAEFGRRRGMDRVDTRRLVHAAAGSWILPSFLLYETAVWAAIPAFLFVGVNALSLRFRLILSIEVPGRGWGTVFFPLSVGTLTLWGWEQPWRASAVAGILSMAWGDAAASWIGRRAGRHVHRWAGHTRTLEGSMAMLVGSWLAILCAFSVFGPAPDPSLVWAALLAAAGATALEAISPWGVDDLLVPLGTAGILSLLHGRLWP